MKYTLYLIIFFITLIFFTFNGVGYVEYKVKVLNGYVTVNRGGRQIRISRELEVFYNDKIMPSDTALAFLYTPSKTYPLAMNVSKTVREIINIKSSERSFKNFYNLFFPSKGMGQKAISKSGGDHLNANKLKIQYPKRAKLLTSTPELSWVGSSLNIELTVYEFDTEKQICSISLRDRHRYILPDSLNLVRSRKYYWQIMDKSQTSVVDVASFTLAGRLERETVINKIGSIEKECNYRQESDVYCQLQKAAVYESEGFSYEAIKLIKNLRGLETILQKLFVQQIIDAP